MDGAEATHEESNTSRDVLSRVSLVEFEVWPGKVVMA